MTISAWSATANIKSPNGELTASYSDMREICMGGPLAGNLIISNGQTIHDCGSSFVWSDDSNFIAVPIWGDRRSQRLGIFKINTGELKMYGRKFRVLEINSFSNNLVSAKDSPIHKPTDIAIDVSERFHGT
jgi:hypothetical protein